MHKITDKRTDVCSRPLCSYSGIFSPKKNWFFWDKIFFQNLFWKILTLFYATFQCGRYNVKNIYFFLIFAHEKLKKPPKKVAQNRPRPLFPTNQPRPQPTAQNWFSISRNFGTRHLFSYLWLKSNKKKKKILNWFLIKTLLPVDPCPQNSTTEV